MESRITLVIIAILGLLVVAGEGSTPVLHRVGGDKLGWRLNVNLSDWASHERFYVGDWLYFGFDKEKFSVLEVNRAGYNNCTENNIITNVTRGGRDVFNLTSARPYYFISGRGYCFSGVKVAINVQDAPPNLHTPTNSILRATPSPSTTSDATTMNHPFFIAIALVWTFLFL